MLAAKTGFDWRTALRWLQGAKVKRSTAISLENAAEALGIELPKTRVEAS